MQYREETTGVGRVVRRSQNFYLPAHSGFGVSHTWKSDDRETVFRSKPPRGLRSSRPQLVANRCRLTTIKLCRLFEQTLFENPETGSNMGSTPLAISGTDIRLFKDKTLRIVTPYFDVAIFFFFFQIYLCK